jgi:osmotically-inducible protein OsmY
MKKLAGILAVSVLTAAAVGCSTTDNTNTTTTTTTTNSNTGTLVNNNGNRNTAGVTTTNTNTTTTRTTNVTREDYEKNKAKYEGEAKSTGSKIGTGLEDGWLWTKTRYDLLAADDLRDSTINVDVENGVVTLRGTVASPAQRARAVAVAKSVSGVKSVKDELKVSPSGNTNANANANANTRTANANAAKKK